MGAEYETQRTSKWTAQVQDVEITAPESPTTQRTRRIARMELVDNAKDPTACVKLTLMNQRRHGGTDKWRDPNFFSAAKLKAGEEIRFGLGAGQTRLLFNALRDMYEVGSDELPEGSQHLRVIDADDSYVATGKEKEIVSRLIEKEGNNFFDLVSELEPDLFEATALTKLYRRRRAIVSKFEQELQKQQWSEMEWDRFFKENTWIFGHGLAYQFLSQIDSQAHYGGGALSGSGGQVGDYLMSTEAKARFTVLVEIKKPDGELVRNKQYRNKVHELGNDLTGGVAQLQSNCRTWAIEGVRQEENAQRLMEEDIYTYEPKGILVVGNTAQLNSRDKKATFELFRRNLHNPEIITYDELLERAIYTTRIE